MSAAGLARVQNAVMLCTGDVERQACVMGGHSINEHFHQIALLLLSRLGAG